MVKSFNYSKPFLFEDGSIKAHRRGSSSSVCEYESLHEHSNLTLQHALDLIDIYNVEGVIDNLSENYDSDIIKDLFLSVIYLHDFGKINPFFQKYKMGTNINVRKFLKEYEEGEDWYPENYTQHSLLSFLFFVDYFLSKYSNSHLDLILKFGFLIIKHHSPYIVDYKSYEYNIGLLKHFLKYYNFKKLNADNVEDILTRKIKDNDESLYYLLRLNFGILTKCDFIATNEFINGYKHKENIIFENKYKNVYWNNDKFLDGSPNFNFNFLNKLKTSISELTNEKNFNNLNRLRTIMLNEAIHNYTMNRDKNVFYLECPTGGGKTNISTALISLMLDDKIKKVFYVFPFNKLSVQTESSIKNSFHLKNDEISILANDSYKELSKEDVNNEEISNYELDKVNAMNNTFMNYPFLLMSHVRFFDIIKSNSKSAMYHLHQLSNSVVILDEIQVYNPIIWSKITYFIDYYAKKFNIKFIIMSATLPKLDKLIKDDSSDWVALINNKNEYYHNPNFKDRVKINSDHLQNIIDEEYVFNLSLNKSEEYYNKMGRCNSIIEFLYKEDASNFAKEYRKKYEDKNYEVYVLSSNTLKSKSNKIIREIKKGKYNKVILICTQCIEAGVDIDMDLGFKDVSIIDSEEQLAGRINRNASKRGSTLYLFNKSRKFIYESDLRYMNTFYNNEYINILQNKNFDFVYDKVISHVNNVDTYSGQDNSIQPLIRDIKDSSFEKVNDNFNIIEDSPNNIKIFIPLEIPMKDIDIEVDSNWVVGDKFSGEKVYEEFLSLIEYGKYKEIKKLNKYLSYFTTNLFLSNRKLPNFMLFIESEKSINGIHYLSDTSIYSYENGFDLSIIDLETETVVI